jgi:hypothetical protein
MREKMAIATALSVREGIREQPWPGLCVDLLRAATCAPHTSPLLWLKHASSFNSTLHEPRIVTNRAVTTYMAALQGSGTYPGGVPSGSAQFQPGPATLWPHYARPQAFHPGSSSSGLPGPGAAKSSGQPLPGPHTTPAALKTPV